MNPITPDKIDRVTLSRKKIILPDKNLLSKGEKLEVYKLEDILKDDAGKINKLIEDIKAKKDMMNPEHNKGIDAAIRIIKKNLVRY